MNASVGRGEHGNGTNGTVADSVIRRVALMEAGDMMSVAGGRGQMRLVGLGDKRVLVVEAQEPELQQAGEVSEEAWQSFRDMIDRQDGPIDEARSLAMFGRVMRRLREQQDTEQRWRWVRRVATALAAAAGAGAVRMLSR